jgi:hypothetical protein
VAGSGGVLVVSGRTDMDYKQALAMALDFKKQRWQLQLKCLVEKMRRSHQ